MIKKNALKRILITTLAFIIVSIIYLFPNSYSKNTIEEKVAFENISKTTIYIPNKDDYVSRTSLISKTKDIRNQIKEIIEYLTIGSINNDYIPNIFYPIIPKNTKLLSLDLNNQLLKINFSKEFLNIKKGQERLLLESLIYSLTEFKEIKEIIIFVEGDLLNKLPNTNEVLENPLKRNIGINKKYNINSVKNTSKITTYYIAKDDDLTYYIPITTVGNFSEEKIEVIINRLKSSPVYETNLHSYLQANTELLEYEVLQDKISLSFNNYIFDDFDKQNILEEVKYSIGLSIKDTYNINTVLFNVGDKLIEEFKII